MRLIGVEATNLRCFERLALLPGPRLNVITGANASGKTSILEAIFMLGRGRSFRGTAPGPVIRNGTGKLVLRGRLQEAGGRAARIGLVATPGGVAYKVDDRDDTKRFDLASTLPLQLIDPDVHRLLEQGPRYRRRFLDWGVFHVEQHFFRAWRQYQRALRQRNGALRAGSSRATVTAWDSELVRAAQAIDAARRHYMQRLTTMLPAAVLRLLAADAPTIDYYRGWSENVSLADALASTLERDRKAGFTQVGPHRADMRVRVDRVNARSHVSRGQQKLLTVALLLAQVRLLASDMGVLPVLLVDDLAAELDDVFLKALLRELEALDVQCFVTFLNAESLAGLRVPARMFHVERGRLVGG